MLWHDARIYQDQGDQYLSKLCFQGVGRGRICQEEEKEQGEEEERQEREKEQVSLCRRDLALLVEQNDVRGVELLKPD